MLGGTQPKQKSKFIHLYLFYLENLGASVAQVQIVQSLEPALEDEDEFLKLFMMGTGKNNDHSFDDDYHDPGNSSGAIALKQMMSRLQHFVIQIEDSNQNGEPVEEKF
jgi:hypothetical protein